MGEPTNIYETTSDSFPAVSDVIAAPTALAPNLESGPEPIVATSIVSVTRRPQSNQSKESRGVKRLSSSGEETYCAQSRTFRALEKLLFEGGDSAALDAPAEVPAPAPVEAPVIITPKVLAPT